MEFVDRNGEQLDTMQLMRDWSEIGGEWWVIEDGVRLMVEVFAVRQARRRTCPKLQLGLA